VPDFEYDVAISFLAEDEAIAIELADLLRDRMSVFLYSERQKDLGGKDGLVEFTAVFKEKTRVVVILYREGWGDTKWTRVEATAIKDRAFDIGWDFLVVVALVSGKGRGAPAWVPKTNIWVDYSRFGLEGAAAVISQKVREAGGEPKEESARERSARLQREAETEEERRNFLASRQGVVAAEKALKALFDGLKREVEYLRSTEREIQFERDAHEFRATMSTPRAGLQIGWSFSAVNSLVHSALLVREFNRPTFLHGEYHGTKKKNPVAKDSYLFTRTKDGRFGWASEKDAKRVFSTEELADTLLKRLLDRTHEARTPQQDEDDDW
jgi:hypothetical protein